MAEKVLIAMQCLQDQAHDLTEELEVLVEQLPPHHEHVVEVADQLGNSSKNGNSSVMLLKKQVLESQDSTPVI